MAPANEERRHSNHAPKARRGLLCVLRELDFSFLLSQWKLGRQSGLKREEWLIGRKQSPVPSSWLELKYKKWSYVLMTALASGLEFAKALKREVTFIAIDPARCCDPELPSE